MTKVYVLTHYEDSYDVLYEEIRGISLNKEKLEAARVVGDSEDPIPDKRYKSGFRAPTPTHNYCCEVSAYELDEIDGPRQYLD